MKLHQILNEKVINALTLEKKQRYADQVWAMLQRSYEPVGGFQSAASPQELIADSGIWKIVTRNGQITAVKIYKDRFGRKSIAAATDGSRKGKQDLVMLVQSDVKMNRSCAEVSGPMEKLMIKVGAKPIPARYAAALTGKQIIDIASDQLHYTRLIAGHPHEKIIYGAVNLDPDTALELKQAGIDLKDLPVSDRK